MNFEGEFLDSLLGNQRFPEFPVDAPVHSPVGGLILA